MTIKVKKRLTIVLCIFANVFMFGQSKYPRVEIKDTELRHLFSKEIGQEYSIDIFLPKSYYNDTSRRYPIVFVLDAEYNFGMVCYVTRRLIKSNEIPEVILVGIAYDTTYEKFYDLRRRDYTSIITENDSFSGGAYKFANFIDNELTSFITSNYRANINDRTIVGHSYGGHFAYYCLFQKPDIFNRYLIVSPSIWYGTHVLLENEKDYFSNNNDMNAIVYTSVGGDERGGPGKYGFDKNGHSMLSYWALMAERIKMRNYPSLKMKDEILLHESHKSVFAPAFTNGMKYVLNKTLL